MLPTGFPPFRELVGTGKAIAENILGL